MTYSKKLFYGNFMLCKFYLESIQKLSKFMPEIKEIAQKSKKDENFEIKFNRDQVNEINSDFKEVNQKVLNIEKNVPQLLEYEAKMIIFFIIRLIQIYTVYYKQYTSFILLSLSQFILLPYSFFSSFSLIPDFLIARYVGSYVSSITLYTFIDYVFPSWLNYKYEIDNYFVFGYIFIEQFICFVFLFVSPYGKTKPVSLKRIMESIVYGFLNTKTYSLVLLFLVRGFKFPVTGLIVDYITGFSTKIFNLSILYRPLFVYIQHRSAHIAVAYGEAHKFHHYLSDTTGFDSHHLGIGAPEEFFMFLMEILPVYALKDGLMPSFSPPLLWQYWDSKIAHVRKDDDHHSQGNFHANHHYYHTKNFSTYSCPLDVLFKTSWDAESWPFINNFKIKRIENEKEVILKFEK